MKKVNNYYQQLSVLALLVFLVLLSLQINWLYQSVQLKKRETQESLQRIVSEVALAFNSQEHAAYHGKSLRVEEIPIPQLEEILDSVLESHQIYQDVSFALYQDSRGGIFHSNDLSKEETLRASRIKSCISCIMRFSIVKEKNTTRLPHEDDDAYLDRMESQAEFQYFSPVQGLKTKPENVIWLGLYLPHPTFQAWQSLLYFLVLNVVLLLILLGLIYHLLNSLQRHKQLSQIKDDFFNNMTHEFKTPLSSIRLASRVLMNDPEAEKKVSFLQLIERETKRMEKQVDQLLGLSMLDQKELALAAQPVPIKQLIQEVPERLRALIDEKQASLHLDLELRDDIIQGDYQHLSNSVCNLVENSLKYSQEKVKIWISTYLKNNKKVIQVRDNGPGIAPQYQTLIFERFFRAQKENQYKGKGFGIGLSYVKGIVEAHQGSIYLNPTYTEGCEFIIEF